MHDRDMDAECSVVSVENLGAGYEASEGKVIVIPSVLTPKRTMFLSSSFEVIWGHFFVLFQLLL